MFINWSNKYVLINEVHYISYLFMYFGKFPGMIFSVVYSTPYILIRPIRASHFNEVQYISYLFMYFGKLF